MTTAKSDIIAASISRTLAERIIAGAIAPGSKLRQEHVAEEFSASHVPVREAFRRLESQGLVVSEPRRGVRVAGFGLEEVIRLTIEVVNEVRRRVGSAIPVGVRIRVSRQRRRFRSEAS